MAICLGLRAVCGATGGLADRGADFVFSTEGSSASMVARSGCAALIVDSWFIVTSGFRTLQVGSIQRPGSRGQCFVIYKTIASRVLSMPSKFN